VRERFKAIYGDKDILDLAKVSGGKPLSEEKKRYVSGI
jgi:hypothetical protein